MNRFPAFAAVFLPRPDAGLARRLLSVSPWFERQGALVVLDPRGTERLHGSTAALFTALRAALAPEQPLGIALAHTRLTAELAARHLRRPIFVPRGDEALFLSRLRLSVLPIPPRLARRWEALGLTTLGELASLPAAAVERRYGAEGLALHRLARGEDARGLRPEVAVEPLEVACALEEPVDRLPRLEPQLAEAVATLAERLGEQGVGARVLELVLQLESVGERQIVEVPPAEELPAEAQPADKPPADEPPADEPPADEPPAEESPPEAALSDEPPRESAARRLRLPEPERRAPLLLDLLRRRVERDPPPRAITGFVLRVPETGELAVHQNSLFGEVRRDAARRREALGRLAEWLGPDAVAPLRAQAAHPPEQRFVVGSSELENEVRAEGEAARRLRARRRKERAQIAARAAGGGAAETSARRARPADERPAVVLRACPQPESLVPLFTGGELSGFRRGRRVLELVALSPARRLEGGWWRHEPWARDEYELLAADGALYRVARDLRARRWVLLGELD